MTDFFEVGSKKTAIRAVFTNRGLAKIIGVGDTLDDRTPNKGDIVGVASALSNLKIKKLQPKTFPSIPKLAGLDYVGYIIEKERLNKETNQWVRTDEYKIIGTATSVFKDTRVAYGEFYRYRIKSVAKITLPIVTESAPDSEVLTVIEEFEKSKLQKEIEKKSGILDNLGKIASTGLTPKTATGFKPFTVKLTDLVNVVAEPSKITVQKLPEKVGQKLATGNLSELTLKKVVNEKVQQLSKTRKVEYVSYYFESDPSKNWIYVDIIENVPPPPPNTFQIVPNSPLKHMAIYWVKPVNDQRDIQTIRVYRRSKVGEAWTRIAEVPERQNMYVDRGVSVGRQYIYALTAIDVHGFESFLSTQVMAELNPNYTLEKVERQLRWISGSGAKISEQNSVFKKFLDRTEQIVAKNHFSIGINSKFAGDDKDLIIRVTSLDTHDQHEFRVKLKNVNIKPKE
jgi:hypothetical protein